MRINEMWEQVMRNGRIGALMVCVAVLGIIGGQPRAALAGMRVAQVSPHGKVVTTYVGTIGGQVAPSETVTVNGTTAYMGEGTDLVVLNVADPATPAEQGRLALPAPATDIQVVNSTAYVATRNGVLVIADVSNSAAPTTRGSYTAAPLMDETDRIATSVHVAKSTAFVTYAVERAGSFVSNMHIVNITNPAAPRFLSAVSPGPKIARDVFVANNLAYVLFASSSAGGLAIYDVSTPSKPVLRSTFKMQAVEQIFVAGTRAYVTIYPDGIREGGLQVLDVSNPAQPSVLGQYNADAASVYVVGTRAYLGGTNGVQIVDISDPAAIQLRSTIATSGPTSHVFATATHAFVSAQGGLHIIDVQAPRQPRLRNTNITRRVLDVRVAGTTAYLYDVAGEPALQIVDLSDPVHPALLGRLPVSFVIEDIAVADGMAYLAAGTDGIQIVDVRNAARPALVGSLDTPGYAYAAQAQGGLAYVADGEEGLAIIDVHTPAAPQLRGTLDTPGLAMDVALAGRVAYVGTIGYVDAPPTDAGVHIIDVAAPATPRLQATYGPLPAQSVEVVDSTLIVAGNDGVAVLDVSNSAVPTLRGAKHDFSAVDVKVIGDRMYAATGTSGVQIIDMRDPTAPIIGGTIPTPGYAQSVTSLGDHLLIADDDGGLHIWRVATANEKQLVYVPFAH